MFFFPLILSAVLVAIAPSDAFFDPDAVVVAFSKQVIFGESRCQEIYDSNATVVQSISKEALQSGRSMNVVEIDPSQTFEIATCENVRGERCGASGGHPNAYCAIQYEWRAAHVRGEPRTHYRQDEILVPSGCTCLIGNSESAPEFAVILESK